LLLRHHQDPVVDLASDRIENASTMNDPLPRAVLSIRDLCKAFGSRTVLREVDVDVASGETVVVIGASGSGKTTLLRCINRLETPDSGSVEVAGEPIGTSE